MNAVNSEIKTNPLVNFILRIVLVTISLAIATYLILVIYSYDANDYSFNTSLAMSSVQNSGGIFGAYLSFFLLYSIGISAYTLPIVIIISAWFSFAKNNNAIITVSLVVTRTIGLLLWLIATASLFAAYVCPNPTLGSMEYCSINEQVFAIPNSGGGEIGLSIFSILMDLTTRPLATLILFVLAIFSVLIFSGLSLIEIMEKSGKFLYKSFIFLKLSSIFIFTQIYNPKKTTTSQSRAKTDNASDPYEKSYFPKANTEQTQVKPKINFSALAKSTFDSIKSMFWDMDADYDYKKVQKEPQFYNPKPNITGRHGQTSTARNSSANIGNLNYPATNFKLPSIDLIESIPQKSQPYTENELYYLSRQLETKLAEFQINAKVDNVVAGPVVTRFEIIPEAGVKSSRITSLEQDLARAMSISLIKIVPSIKGKSSIEIEIPNKNRQIVDFKKLVASSSFKESQALLTIALGRNVSDKVIFKNLAKMPHLLVAGTTGSGKSVGINSMIVSLLFKARPDQLKLIMIDPKRLELNMYEGIPHLLCPIVTDMKESYNVVNWCVLEMERRYTQIAALNTRNIDGYNNIVNKAIASGRPIKDPLYTRKAAKNFADSGEPVPTLEPLPSIVLVIDEYGDMISTIGKKIEDLITRLTQKARASGIHLILATQRPSVNVVTGLIKANIPSRIAFRVSSHIDSKTIIDRKGAEMLLGNGDMLFLEPGLRYPERIHGSFISDQSILRIVDYLKTQGSPNYLPEITSPSSSDSNPANTSPLEGELDEYFDEVVDFVLDNKKVSISSIQRKFGLGFNRAARIVDQMQERGIVSAPKNNKREILGR